MKKVIVYASKTNTTKECAERIYNEVEGFDLIDLNEKGKHKIDDYDVVVLGSYFRIARAPKAMRKFVNKNFKKILTKEVYMFCLGNPDSFEKLLEKNYPSKFIEHLAYRANFGAKLRIDTAKGYEGTLIAGMLQSYEVEGKEPPTLIEENIVNFIEKLK